MPGETKPHAVLLASPGMGHLIPVMELAKRMVAHHGFHVTVFIVPSDSDSTPSLKSSSPIPNDHHLDIVTLPEVDISDLVPSGAPLVAQLFVRMRESLSSLKSSIAAMKYRPTALIVDLFGGDALPIADEFGMLKYVFDTTTAWFLAVTLHSSSMDRELLFEEHVKCHKPLKIPGCKSLRFEDTLDSFKKIDAFDGFQLMGKEMTKTNGILINTWEELESSTIKALRDHNSLKRVVKVQIYPVGPLIRKEEGEKDLDIKNWLDKQPAESVIYVSFGSEGTLSAEQITELAWGLEQSKQRFIWVVRPPSQNARESYFTRRENKGVGNGTPDYLPAGFCTRTKDIGLVIPTWGPQAQILSHPSVGGFLSHCGWNSSLESISNGVPMIAWPLYAEQKMNSAMLTEDIGIAVRPKASPTEETVGSGEIEKMVRMIMEVDIDKEGYAMRKRAKELQKSAEKALSKGGSSYNSLSQVAKVCLDHLQP